MSLLLFVFVVTLAWVLAPLGTGQFGDVIRAAAAFWLLANGGSIEWQNAAISLPPLLLTLILILFMRRAGGWIADAVDADDRGEKVILVRNETSPEDVHGMMVSQGILTARGGLVSHAAVVARGWGTPAIVGAEAIKIEGKQFTVGSSVVKEGDVISIDGTTASVRWQVSADNGRNWSAPRTVAETTDASDHPMLVAYKEQAYLSWLTAKEGYRLLPLEVAP